MSETDNTNFNKFFNVTTSVNGTTPVTVTSAEIWIQLIFFYFFLGGVLATSGNVAMAVGIFKSKKLRNRFFVFVGALIFTRVVLGSQLLMIFIYRTLRTLNIVDTNVKRGWCFLVHVHLPYVMTLELCLLLAMVIDKIMAIIAFNYYRNLTNRHAIHLCFVLFVGTLAFKQIPSLFGIDFFEIIPCVNSYSPLNPIFTSYTQNIDLALALLILVLYLILIIYLRFFKRDDDKNDQAEALALKRQLKLMPLLRRLVLTHCGLSLGSKLLLAFAGALPNLAQQRLVLYGGSLITVDLFANMIMLLISNKDLRQASLGCGVNSVEASKGGSAASKSKKEARKSIN